MRSGMKVLVGLLCGSLLVLVVNSVFAAEGRGGGGERGAGGERVGGAQGRFDPEQFRQRMLDQLKQSLEVNDEEWQVLKPRIEKVMTLSRQARTGRMGMMMMGRRGGEAGGERADMSEVERKLRDLETTLGNKDATVEEIKAQLAALREAREKARQELAQAQASLQELLTPKQEARLVLAGILE